MEDLGNTGDGDVLPPPNQTPNLRGVAENDEETAELVQIGLGEGPALSREQLRPTLNSLLGMLNSLRLRNNYHELVNVNSGPQDKAPYQTLKGSEAIKIIQSLYTTFAATGNIDHLDNAIGIAGELAASVSSDKLNPEGLLALTTLLRARYCQTKGLEDLGKAIKWMEVTVAEIPPDHPDRVGELERLSTVLFERYERYEALGDLGQTIKWAKEAVKATPPDHPDRARMLVNLGTMLGSRYGRLGDLQDLEQAIMRAEEAVAATPPDHPNRAAMLSNLGIWLGNRYNRLGDLQDLEQAIMRTEEAVAATPSDRPNRTGMLKNLGIMLSSRYDQLGDLQDLEQAIMWGKEVVAATPPGHLERAGMLNNLGDSLGSRYKRLGDLQDLEQAIMRVEEAVAATPPDHPYRAGRLNNLGIWLDSRYKRLGHLQDLEQAIMRAEEVIAATPPDHLDRAAILNNLGNRLDSRYNRFGDLQDLEQAIMRSEEAVAAIPSDHPNRADMLINLGNRLGNRYTRFGGLQDLGQAIMWVEEAIAATPPNHLDRGEVLSNLGDWLGSRYSRLGHLQDLEQAIMRAEEAVAATPPDHPNRAGRLNSLGIWLHSRYDRLGDLQDLEQAIMRAEEAVAATPPDHPNRTGMLKNLGAMLGNRYRRLGDLQDLEQAITRTEEAIAATPPDHPSRAGRLGSLGAMLDCRYNRLGDLQDLEQAIMLAEEAITATPPDNPGRTGILVDLGSMLGSRYDRLGDLQDLEQAIMRTEEAVAATPPDHPDRAGMLSNLGNWLGRRYKRLGDLQDLERAIMRAEEVIAATPPEHPNRAGMLNNLGIWLHSRYDQLGDLQDLEQAIMRGEEAVAATPPGHLERIFRLSTLIDACISKYRQTNSAQDFNYILRISHEAWHCNIAAPKVRILIARKAGLLLASRKMWKESSTLLEEAVKMLPRVSSRSLGRGDQEHRLSDFTRLAAEAVSIALQAGEEAAHGLKLLELGRGIITGLVIDCRSDLSELQSKHPELFNEFHQLRIEVDSPLVTDNDRHTYQQERRRREKAVEELEEALSSIRQLPGFEGFQLPPRSDHLMAMASEGPIAIFNSTRFRSDAIIVTSSTIKTLALPKLLYSSVEERMGQIAKLARGNRSTYQRRNEKMREILLWLWDVAVEPVFGALQQDTVVDTSNLPRIWWVGVGLLAMAPFHAAGDHSPGSTRNTISRAISSYIPTIKSLSYARQKKLELLSRPDSRLLLVTMPTTPAEKSHKPPRILNNAAKEVEIIADIVKGKTNTTQLDCPSTAQVIAELPSYHAIHFACHGVSDGRSPSNSHLILRKDDGSELGAPDKLTVGAISNTNIKQAQIAYLSACSTAENASASLVDESIYIASGFQLAGFSHVLATQWISNDGACLQVAGDFYSSLFSGQSSGEEGHRRVSAAFHYAVKKLRDKNPRQPILWAPYIHTGA